MLGALSPRRLIWHTIYYIARADTEIRKDPKKWRRSFSFGFVFSFRFSVFCVVAAIVDVDIAFDSLTHFGYLHGLLHLAKFLSRSLAHECVSQSEMEGLKKGDTIIEIKNMK